MECESSCAQWTYASIYVVLPSSVTCQCLATVLAWVASPCVLCACVEPQKGLSAAQDLNHKHNMRVWAHGKTEDAPVGGERLCSKG